MKDKLIISGIVLLFVLSLIPIGIIVVNIHKHRNDTIEQLMQPVPVHIPLFQRGDCFEGNWEREPWEDLSTPDGIVEMVGKNSYLVLFRTEAEKRGNVKRGLPLPIASFDRNHNKVPCPDTWVRHSHNRK